MTSKGACFVAMPFGHDKDEQRWYKAWYQEVIKPAVEKAGYSCVLSSLIEEPEAINDEIRIHLANDPMVLVDLGGYDDAETPNANVMYELGIRHAFDLPVVIMARPDQDIPFDVSNQRIIIRNRHPINFAENRELIVSFINAAEEGRFYRPMQAVKRASLLQEATESLAPDNVINILIDEIRSLHNKVDNRQKTPFVKPATIKRRLLRSKADRKPIYDLLISLGGNAANWNRILSQKIDDNFIIIAEKWGDQEWKQFLIQKLEEFNAENASNINYIHNPQLSALIDYDEDLLEKVEKALPPQPWPTDTAKNVAEQLGLNGTQMKKYVSELVRRGKFKRQINGKLFDADGNEIAA